MKRIGILTGGGDAPGLNAVIRAVVHTAMNEFDAEVIGLRNGFDGLLEPEYLINLSHTEVRGILSHGGTILGAANRGNPFSRKEIVNGKETIVDMSDKALQNIEKLKLDSLIVVGGDGTLTISKALYDRGAPIVGVPKTIDNDMGGTDITFGFDTAMHTATEALDKLHTTAESHSRAMILELMGRNAGWIALGAGIAGGADAILIPEIAYDLDHVIQKFEERALNGSHFNIVSLAEGAHPIGGTPQYQSKEGTYAGRLGGIGNTIANALNVNSNINSRCTILGHLQRGGTPTPYDRWLASLYGAGATHLAMAGAYGYMVNITGRDIGSISLADAVSQTPKLVNPNGDLVKAVRGMGITFGDE